ncbi:hypothetical protein [uncultured Algibacter sp.]|uniref:hypothetical protein n=1 Tax=uncultured Algibacter sp. TaxID=298659 RepID=UPI00261EC557|nr:hypothetical protein [uncultured Algibacter sp.]
MDNLELITLTKSSLKDAITEDKYWNGTFQPPFSKNKAKWILENDRASNEDVIAILGYENHNIIALVYLVPDLIKSDNGKLKKIFWSQRWWVSDKYKDTVLSTYIKSVSLNACNNQVVVKFLGDGTKAYYEKQPFIKFAKRNRYIFVFSIDHGLLINKKNSLQKVKPLLKLIDGLSRKIIASLNKSKIKSKHFLTKNVEFIDDNIWFFIEKLCLEDLVPKSKDYINWQISNNQYEVIQDGLDKAGYKCLLNSISNKIYNINTVVKFENEIIGFISAYVSGNRFVIRYFVANEPYYRDCVNVMIKNFIQSKCTILQTEDTKLGELINSSYFKVYSDVKELVSLKHNDIDINLNSKVVKDQDGNMF